MRPFAVIAHRGASGYLPEHTLEAAAMAHAMRVDYIEQDVVLTRDGQLLVLHDLYLDNVTDVARRFPGRQRPDGRHYVIDFTLDEIRTLRLGERIGPGGTAVFGGRFPAGEYLFHIPTLAEEILLVQGLNRATRRSVGFYIEPKAPAWHHSEGQDLFMAVLNLLDGFGLNDPGARVLLQSFDLDELRRARVDLQTPLPLVQLIGENAWQESPSDFDYLRSEDGLREIADFAQGIGPWLPQVIEIKEDGQFDISGLTAMAHRFGLFVHGYTLRADQLPQQLPNLARAVELLVHRVELDGVFTDHPDLVVEALKSSVVN